MIVITDINVRKDGNPPRQRKPLCMYISKDLNEEAWESSSAGRVGRRLCEYGMWTYIGSIRQGCLLVCLVQCIYRAQGVDYDSRVTIQRSHAE